MPRIGKVMHLAPIAGYAALMLSVASCSKPSTEETILASFSEEATYGELTVTYPYNEALFPPEMIPPVFRWEDDTANADAWLISFAFKGDGDPIARLMLRCPQGSMLIGLPLTATSPWWRGWR